MKGILGKKLGMSQVFLINRQLVPVTIIEIQPNVVSQVKTNVKDKYNSLQLTSFDLHVTLSNKPTVGHFKKADSNRVFKSQPTPGQMGNVTRSIFNIEMIKVDKENNYLSVKGSVPGPKQGLLVV